MGLFGFWGKKGNAKSEAELILNGAEGSEVIVPDHAKPKAAVKGKNIAESKKNIFRISGVYDVKGEVMLLGDVESGFVKKRLKTKIGDKDIFIRDVKVGTQSVKEVHAANKGTIFLKGKNIHFLRPGDALEFK